jgi:hypothetical protein
VPVSLRRATCERHARDGACYVTVARCRRLALSSNALHGALPDDIGLLRDLEGLWLQTNRLVGSIPHTLSLLTRLHTAALDFNRFTGSLPEGLSRLEALK